jgi:hypothetical protein
MAAVVMAVNTTLIRQSLRVLLVQQTQAVAAVAALVLFMLVVQV